MVLTALNSTYILLILRYQKDKEKRHPVYLHEAQRRALSSQILKITNVNLYLN